MPDQARLRCEKFHIPNRSVTIGIRATSIWSASLPTLTCINRQSAEISTHGGQPIDQRERIHEASGNLVDIGDPLDLEVVADLLSTDAVQIKVGAPVRIDGWGGPALQGKVVRVDPAGFLKVSALGIEEQRVRVTIDFVDPPEAWAQLGHDYRVIVHVAIWSADNALTVPVSALFRKGDD